MDRISKFTVLAFAFLMVITGGCKKLSNDTSLLVLNVYPYFGNDSITAGKTYVTASGDSISFSRTSFYISNIQLNNTDGTAFADSGYILVTSSNYENLIAGSVPTGTYKSISFNVGVTSSLNHVDPTTYSSGPLATQSPSMHFADDNAGYIFMAVEGLVGSSAGVSPGTSFSYHVGTDSLLQTVNLPDHSSAPYSAVFTASGTKLVTINIVADFSQLLQRVNVAANPVTNTNDFPVVADTIAKSIPGMFRYLN